MYIITKKMLRTLRTKKKNKTLMSHDESPLWYLPAEGSFANLSLPKQLLRQFIGVWSVLYRQILIFVISVNRDFLKFPVSEWRSQRHCGGYKMPNWITKVFLTASLQEAITSKRNVSGGFLRLSGREEKDMALLEGDETFLIMSFLVLEKNILHTVYNYVNHLCVK